MIPVENLVQTKLFQMASHIFVLGQVAAQEQMALAKQRLAGI